MKKKLLKLGLHLSTLFGILISCMTVQFGKKKNNDPIWYAESELEPHYKPTLFADRIAWAIRTVGGRCVMGFCSTIPTDYIHLGCLLTYQLDTYLVYSCCTGFGIRTLTLGQPCGLSPVNSINSNQGLVLRTVKIWIYYFGNFLDKKTRLSLAPTPHKISSVGRKYDGWCNSRTVGYSRILPMKPNTLRAAKISCVGLINSFGLWKLYIRPENEELGIGS